MSTESRTEQLLNAYINGDDISNFVPLSRNEQILKDMILGNEQTSSPQSRIESLYKKLDEKIKQGSGGDNNLLQYIIDNKDGDGKPSCSSLFYNYKGSSLDAINKLDTSKVTNMTSMFTNCSNLTSIPQLDTSSCTNMTSMFNSCYKLTTIPQLDTSNVTSMSSMFAYCSRLTSIPQLDTSKVTNMTSMFTNCVQLTSIPQLNTSNVTSMSGMFPNCQELTSIPQLDTSKVTSMYETFTSCFKLTTIPQLDMNNVTNTKSTFNSCRALTYLKLLNVKTSLQIGSGTSWGHLIEKDCLIQIISELINTGSSETLTMGTANKAKIANTYVKLLEDDGTGKHPFEVCASTDEGAMTIEAYCNSKNWTLA